MMHDGTSQLVNAVLLLLSEAKNIKGILKEKRGIILCFVSYQATEQSDRRDPRDKIVCAL